MSLINEALKRAAQEKRRAGGRGPTTLFSPTPSASTRRSRPFFS